MIRIRHAEGASTVHTEPGMTLEDLRALIFSQTNIAPEDQELKTGIPPRALADVPLTTPLSDPRIHVGRGDQVLVAAIRRTAESAPNSLRSHRSNLPSSLPISALPPTPAATASGPPHSTSFPPSGPSISSPTLAPSGYTTPPATSASSTTPPNAAPAARSGKLSRSVEKIQRLREQAHEAAHRRQIPALHAHSNPPNHHPPSSHGQQPSIAPSHSIPSTSQAPATPASSHRPGVGSLSSTAPANRKHYRALDDELVALNIVPDDNSCLFTSVAVVLERTDAPAQAQNLRRVVADTILSHAEEYTEAFLGQAPAQYAAKILRPNVWGGAIELSILSQHFGVEINSVDIATGRVDRYGESSNFSHRVFLAYSGIHYDPIILTPVLDAPLDFVTTKFEPNQADNVISVVLELAEDLRQKRYYTNVSSFTLRCKQCGASLVGEKGAVHHSTVSGHTDFEEYS